MLSKVEMTLQSELVLRGCILSGSQRLQFQQNQLPVPSSIGYKLGFSSTEN